MSNYRKAIGNRRSQRLFSKTAGVNRKNVQARPMRGGIRL